MHWVWPLVVKKTTSWVTPVILGLSGMSLLFSLGITFGAFRVDVIEFFHQAGQVKSNTAEMKAFKDEMKAQLKIYHIQNAGLSARVDRLSCLVNKESFCEF